MSMMSAHQRIRRALAETKKKETTAAVNGDSENTGNNPYAEFEAKSVNELKSFAKINVIDISGLTKKEPIKAKIIEALKAKNGNASDGSPVNDNTGNTDNPDGNNNNSPVNDNSSKNSDNPPDNDNPHSNSNNSTVNDNLNDNDPPVGEGDGGNGSDGGTT